MSETMTETPLDSGPAIGGGAEPTQQGAVAPGTTGQETDAVDGYVPADLAGRTVRVLPAQRWRASHLRALNSGDLDAFAEGVLYPGDVAIWYEVDPTQDEIGAWVRAVAEAGGEALGKSSGRTTSSRSTARR
ncbi:hypothetical protein [Streptomyces sp. NPDC037389]|uniref:hypothetical protein n=1 Tax=Streptomyces sp. NPDC037389 TaxID=3155369 RepID=UPI0033DFD7E0